MGESGLRPRAAPTLRAMSTMAIVLASVSLAVAVAALSVATHQAVLNRRRFRREGKADVKPEGLKVYENPNAPAGWQATVTVRNGGAATAFNPALWITDRAVEPLTHRFGGRGTLEPGEAAGLSADLPSPPQDGALHVWIGWEDARGPQERDTGYRI